MTRTPAPATTDYGIGKVDDALAQLDEKMAILRRYAAEGRLNSLTLAFRYVEEEGVEGHRTDGLMFGQPEELACLIEAQLRHSSAALDAMTTDGPMGAL